MQIFKIDTANIAWELHKPFDLLLKCSGFKEWRYLVETFQEGKIKFTIGLQQLKTVIELNHLNK